ncbi:cyclin-T isoform X2 [Hermetia illucens]|uniref:cyclin-T isoform X2 n=1 Tax=Hermetia illucens TaxID=343691 RepID=UPI0018CC6C96|nr:cyclin-T isoform X2 [Hermetia illucens]
MASNSNAAPSTSSDSKDSRWYFTAEQLANSPSRRQGIDANQELSYRQQTAYLIQEMGQRLSVSQLCINTAIVYMHRFYAFHSFTHFHRNGIAAASLFLAAKVEEQPRKLEHVIKVAHLCLSTEFPHAASDVYNEQAQDLVFNENVLLQTLGFDVAIDHPHTHVVKTCHLVKACKDLAQTSYFLASNSLHLTSMCLQYRPTVVACFCIYLACKWSRWEIPQSTEGKHWFHYVDTSVTLDLLKQLTDEFLAIYEKSPARLKSKLNSIKALAQSARMNEPQRPIADANGSNSQVPPESARRPESYSSHHRHHSSASSHHTHHSKPQLPPTESGDHGKPTLSHKQQQPYTSASSGSGHSSSRPPRPDRPQLVPDGQMHPSHGGSNKQPVLPNVPRPSSSRPPHGMPIPSGTSNTSQRLPHGPHDPNYHKNRSSIQPPNNPSIVSGHKSMSKSNDPQRSLLKDPSGRPIDPNKIPAKHSSGSNMGSSNNNSNSNMFTGPNVGATGIDLTRNVQQISQPQLQRPFVPTNVQPPTYNQTISSRSNSNSSLKYDQSVQQQQQQMHLQSGQKQSLESSFNQQQQASSRQIDESSNNKTEQMEICSPTKYYPQPPSVQSLPVQPPQANLPQPVTSQSKTSSIFSPEWNDKVATHPNLPLNTNSKTSSDSNLDRPSVLGLGMKQNRESPKRSDRERRSETPKKDKTRPDQQPADPSKFSMQSDKRNSNKKVIDIPNQPMIQNTASGVPPYDTKNQQALNLSGVKRPSEGVARLDEERDVKIRKVEPQLSPKSSSDQKQMYPFDQGGSVDSSRSAKPSYSSTVNGIETDPDLVRNLLKESLCTDNKFLIKPEPILNYVDIKPIEPLSDMETLPAQLLQNESPIKETIKEEPSVLVPSLSTSGNTSGDAYSKSKAEKKKKKDKHKHKEKDKSKDKEERKKHKKDKNKERSSGNEQEQNHVKLTIPKEKLNLTSLGPPPSLPTSELKIKIPKDRIRAELTQYQVDDNVHTAQPALAPPPQPSSLKIKISKDKIESYSHHSQHHSSSSYSSSGSHHSHHSSKKKDRDRDKDREKDKKRSSSSSNNDHNKQNGSGSGGGSGSGLSESTSASTKNQSSNSNKEIWVNS